jgi:hypothetical protein
MCRRRLKASGGPASRSSDATASRPCRPRRPIRWASHSDRRKAMESWLLSPVPARVAWNRTLATRLGFHCEIDFGVNVGGVHGHVTEPGAGRVDVDTRWGLSSSPLDREEIVLMRSSVRSKILDPSRSISSADCRPAASPICCTARKRIPAIEICISCRFRGLIQPTSDDRRSTSKRIEQARPSRYTATAARISEYRVRPTTR